MSGFTSAMRARTGTVALLSVGMLVLAGCSGGTDGDGNPGEGGGKKSGDPPTVPFEARSVPFAHKDGPAHVDLVALSRTPGNTVTAHFKVTNDGQAPLKLTTVFGDQSNDRWAGNISSTSGVGLLDGRNNKLYMPLRTKEPKCLCSELQTLQPGGSVTFYTIHAAPPANVRRVTVTMPNVLPMEDVPLSTAAVRPLQGQIDPTKVQLAPPHILPVKAVSEGAELGTSDEGDTRDVRLSADVLFALNKADLTPRADALLRKVAPQIDASKGKVIKVDGHADSSGNDAINQPLSERRAQAVADRLKTLVTRKGVTFKAAGHGSSQPIASNDSEKGRRKNRRVSVSFPRPPAPAPPAPAGKPYQRGDKGVLKSGQIAQKPELKFDINSMHRGGNGLTTMVWTLKNTGGSEVDVEHLERNINLHGSAPRNRGFATGGVMLVDPAAKLRHWPLESQHGHCQCYTFIPDAKQSLGAGESVILWGIYKIPPGLRTIDVQVPWDNKVAANVTGVPVS